MTRFKRWIMADFRKGKKLAKCIVLMFVIQISYLFGASLISKYDKQNVMIRGEKEKTPTGIPFISGTRNDVSEKDQGSAVMLIDPNPLIVEVLPASNQENSRTRNVNSIVNALSSNHSNFKHDVADRLPKHHKRNLNDKSQSSKDSKLTYADVEDTKHSKVNLEGKSQSSKETELTYSEVEDTKHHKVNLKDKSKESRLTYADVAKTRHPKAKVNEKSQSPKDSKFTRVGKEDSIKYPKVNVNDKSQASIDTKLTNDYVEEIKPPNVNLNDKSQSQNNSNFTLVGIEDSIKYPKVNVNDKSQASIDTILTNADVEETKNPNMNLNDKSQSQNNTKFTFVGEENSINYTKVNLEYKSQLSNYSRLTTAGVEKLIKYPKVNLNDKSKLSNVSKYSADVEYAIKYPKRNLTDRSSIKKYKFKNYDIRKPDKFTLKYSKQVYFFEVGNRTCFLKGTNVKQSFKTGDTCICLNHYHGVDCGIPDAVWYGYLPFSLEDNIQRRQVPRRVINGLPVNHEFGMFEARMFELFDQVDVFIIGESNYTAHGDPKDLRFLKRFQKGYLAEFQKKFLYVHLGFFAKEAKLDGWVADSYLRTYLGEVGLGRLKGSKDDDIFILSDADELPSKEVVTFLKLYDGYPEPVTFGLRWNIFSFHWMTPASSIAVDLGMEVNDRLTEIASVATLGMVWEAFLGDVLLIRKKSLWNNPITTDSIENYRKTHKVKDWQIGVRHRYAGWHCSWCFSPENVVIKLDSAQEQDKPRWGDYPEKKNISYVNSLLRNGRWFDDKTNFIAVRNPLDIFYAPPHFLKHADKYRSLLFHPDHPVNKNKPYLSP